MQLNSKSSGSDCCFFWIPKTAGSSIFASLHASLEMQKRKRPKHFLSFPNKGAVTFGHVSYLDLRSLGVISDEYHHRAYKFCIVRNPFTRAVSLFNYLKAIRRIDKDLEFEGFLDLVSDWCPPVGLYNSRGISQANQQTSWIIGEHAEFLVDDIFHLEDLDRFKNVLEKRFNRVIDLSTRVNVSEKTLSLDDAYASASNIEKVRIIYRRDFDLLGYRDDVIPLS